MTVGQIITFVNGCTKVALYGGTNTFVPLWNGLADDFLEDSEVPYINSEVDYITVPEGSDTLVISITTTDTKEKKNDR